MIILQSPGAIALSVGSLTIRWYGILIATGFLVSTWFASRLAKSVGLDQDKLVNLFLICFISGVIGARLYFVFLNWGTYIQHPEQILATWLGGMSIHGGLIGGALGGCAYALKTKLPIRLSADIAGCIMPLGQAIGRWGNFFNSEAFGSPVPKDFPIALFIPPEQRPAKFMTNEFFHATFLYECIWNLAVFGLLYGVLFRRLKKWPGLTFLAYLILYSIGRLLIEPIRTDSIMNGQTPVPIIASVATIIIAIALIPVAVKMSNKQSQGSQTNESPPEH